MDIQRKIITIITTTVAGLAATRIVSLLWKAATGQKPPKNGGDDLAIPIGKALTFAAITGAITALAQTLASRQALSVAARVEKPTITKAEKSLSTEV